MADGVFNISKGRFVEFYHRVKGNDPATSGFVVLLLNASEADDTLNNHDTLAALLAGANTEIGYTNYARKVLTDSDLAAIPAPDDTNNRYDIDLPDQTWTALGAGAALSRAIVCYAPDTGGADSTFIPVFYYDYTPTPDGSDLTMSFNASGAGRAT